MPPHLTPSHPHTLLRLLLLSSLFSLLSSFFSLPSFAQITPDGTVGTIVTGGPNFTIDGGNRPTGSDGLPGPNLFHSFSQFSVTTGGAAIFNNAPDVTNIISRVTGGSISNIDGPLQANGTANLFLINPAGILFGPNASLNIGGSFIGSTAQSLKFSDGTEFSATNPSASPLLTINVPIGLQMGPNSGKIAVQGTGHRLTGGFLEPFNSSNNPVGLQIGADRTLALIGGGIDFSGGVVPTHAGGYLEVGSASNGLVRLNLVGQRWMGDYSAVQLNDISLAQQSLLHASGDHGAIQIQGRNISLTEGSVVLLENFGNQISGGITVNASGSLTLAGTTSDGKLGSQIHGQNLGMGQVGDTNITARQFSIQDGGRVAQGTITPGLGNNITVNVAESLTVDGFAPNDPSKASSINTGTLLNTGNAGDVIISSGNLRILNGAIVGSVSLGLGRAGTIRVTVQDLLEITGNNSFILQPSSIASVGFSSGNAGDTLVNAARLILRDGGALGANGLATGSAGSVIVNASDFVEVTGRGTNSITPSRIASTAEIVDPATQAAYNLPLIPTGDAGSLIVNTPVLRITEGGALSVKNDGSGRAGDLQINAHSIFLDQGNITAATASGNGGNIKLNVQSSLQLRHGSLISATAGSSSDGGNITISAPVIVGFENSDIVANAFQGKGGNIQITTKGIFGLKFRPQLTPENDITASSQFGANGTVAINNVTVDPVSGLVELPVALADASRKMGSLCQQTEGSSFVYTGRGGLPETPLGRLESPILWDDVRDLSAFQHQPPVAPPVRQAAEPTFIVEANAIRRHPDGRVELVAEGTESLRMDSAVTCTGRLWFGETQP